MYSHLLDYYSFVFFFRGNQSKKNTITHIPYYGGAKGQTLEIIEAPDGSFTTNILQGKLTQTKDESQFAKDIKNIHQAALEIIRLHEQAKHKQQLNEEERQRYDKGIEQLNSSTKNLAQLQVDDSEERSNLQFWFEKKKEAFGSKNEGAENNKEPNKEEENVGEESGGNEPAEPDNESVAINLPPPDASVAEAKPVGLAIAGIGGVAASKPIATAVVGPGGLAIARPVATAIAGVAPEDAVIPLSGEEYLKLPEKKKEKCDKKKCEKEKPTKEEKPEKDEDFYSGAFRIKTLY